jgi:hypothetical protein
MHARSENIDFLWLSVPFTPCRNLAMKSIIILLMLVATASSARLPYMYTQQQASAAGPTWQHHPQQARRRQGDVRAALQTNFREANGGVHEGHWTG